MRRRYKKDKTDQGHVGRPRHTSRNKEAIKWSEYEFLMSWLEKASGLRDGYILRYQRAFTLLFLTGMRSSELGLIEVDDIRHAIREGFYSLTNKTKTGKPRKVLLSDRGVGMLQKYFAVFLEDESIHAYNEKVFATPRDPNRRRALNMATMNTDMNDVLHAAFNSVLYSTHGFRSGVITEMAVDMKLPIKVVSQFIGHSSEATTLKYVKVQEQDISEAVNLAR